MGYGDVNCAGESHGCLVYTLFICCLAISICFYFSFWCKVKGACACAANIFFPPSLDRDRNRNDRSLLAFSPIN